MVKIKRINVTVTNNYFSYLRHLLERYDGPIKWNAPRGEIGQAMLGLNGSLGEIIDFDVIQTNLVGLDSKIFQGQNDLKSLVEHCFIVASGKYLAGFDEEIARRAELQEYPEISTVRWRTTALRALGKTFLYRNKCFLILE